MKECPGCGEVKLETEFHKHRSQPDGLQAHCKECILRKQRNSSMAKKAKARTARVRRTVDPIQLKIMSKQKTTEEIRASLLGPKGDE
jgi:hypothetical protein